MKRIYTIEIVKAYNKYIWYRGMTGQRFEAEKHGDKFWVNNSPLFKVFEADCKILSKREEKEYVR